MPAAIPMAVAGAVVSARMQDRHGKATAIHSMVQDAIFYEQLEDHARSLIGNKTPTTAKECNGCGAPLKYTRHCCEYCGRNP